MHDLSEGVTGELLIGAAPAISTYVLPAALKAFRSAHPDVRLGVRTGHSEEVLEMVLREDVRIGLARPVRHPEIESTPLYEDEVVLVVGARHAFASRRRISMDDLASELLILFDRTSSYYDLTSALFRGAGIVPAGTMELDNAEAAKKMVMLELGVALLPRTAVAGELASRELRAVEITGAPPLRRPVVALRRRDAGKPTGPVAWFLETLDELHAGPRRRKRS
ncbi:MAG: LysR family transcriptional regulator substrate-binding protein [Chloroflexi bacterium]|nr:LysR family transcriptional regulator substrate-binding protein [Chloroflexota bacterium]